VKYFSNAGRLESILETGSDHTVYNGL